MVEELGKNYKKNIVNVHRKLNPGEIVRVPVKKGTGWLGVLVDEELGFTRRKTEEDFKALGSGPGMSGGSPGTKKVKPATVKTTSPSSAPAKKQDWESGWD